MSCFATLSNASNIPFNVITDRTTYISGEDILVNVFISDSHQAEVICLQLLSAKGNHINGTIIAVSNGRASGFLNLPDSLSSGCYFLKASASQFAGNSYVLKELRVFNRFEEVQNQFVYAPSQFEYPDYDSLLVTVNGLNNLYERRDSVTISFSISGEQQNKIAGDLHIQVVKNENQYNSCTRYFGTEKEDYFQQKGVFISGKVYLENTTIPKADAVVYISIPDSVNYFDYCSTDVNGNFSFFLNEFYGNWDINVGIYPGQNSGNLEIELNEQFETNDSVNIKFEKHHISKELDEYILLSKHLVRSLKIYNCSLLNRTAAYRNLKYSYPFFGEPEYKIFPSKYYELSDFKEISKEILPGVIFREQDSNYSIRVLNKPVEQYFESFPLLLVNGIPLDNADLIAELGSNDIDYIEVLQGERYFGDLQFKGVLAIRTTKNDFVSILNITRGLANKQINGLQSAVQLSQAIPHKEYVPDFRKVLFWQPNVKPSENMEVSFRTSDVKGEFQLQIYGKTKLGKVVKYCQNFNVN